MRYFLIAATAAVLGAASVAQATDYEEQIRVLLARVDHQMSQNGYDQTHKPAIYSVQSEGQYDLTLTLNAKGEYGLVAVCDEDCDDIDIALYDENDNLIDEDADDSDVAIVEVTPKWTGKFTARVTMYGCDTEICYFGMGTYAK